jgi:SAM-dependent methyltransferase
MADDDKNRLKRYAFDETALLRATFSGQAPGHVVPWTRVTVRPVLLKGKRHVQLSYYDAHKCISKNVTGAGFTEEMTHLLEMGFKNIVVDTSNGAIQVQITSKGKVHVHERAPSGQLIMPDLSHDRQKNLLLPAGNSAPFLHELDITTSDGRVKADMQRKFRQINHFLEIVDQAVKKIGGLNGAGAHMLSTVDCGCGNAYLTFATYHYFNHILEKPMAVKGIDVQEELLTRDAERSRHLGWANLTFEATKIIDFQPAGPPDVVLALHACDTATDEALAQAIRWQSTMVFCAPCCHHHLQQQLQGHQAPSPYEPVLRHGVLSERLGDILTDALRALILRIMGYQTEVIQFISTEHTAKNLMIRAIKSVKPGDPKFVREYRALTDLWHVTPYLAQLLGEDFAALVTSCTHG